MVSASVHGIESVEQAKVLIDLGCYVGQGNGIAEAMPVDDAMVEWPEKLSPYVTVGRVHLPRQDISRPENLEKGDALAFNQWRVTADHRPLGEIMQVRRIYSTSAKVRRALNHQSQTEPTNVDEVLSQ